MILHSLFFILFVLIALAVVLGGLFALVEIALWVGITLWFVLSGMWSAILWLYDLCLDWYNGGHA